MGKSYALDLKLPELRDGWVKGTRFLLSRHSPEHGSELFGQHDTMGLTFIG